MALILWFFELFTVLDGVKRCYNTKKIRAFKVGLIGYKDRYLF